MGKYHARSYTGPSVLLGYDADGNPIQVPIEAVQIGTDSNGKPIYGLRTDKAKNVKTITLISDATFTTEVDSSQDIDFSNIRSGIISIVAGTVTSGGITVKLQKKDSKGNYTDYLVLPTLSAAGNVWDDFADLPFKIGKLVAVPNGTTSIAHVTVEMECTP